MIGQTISHYKILEKLGEGGMGVVYKAEDTKLERPVALKFLSPSSLGTEEEKVRFFREAKAAAILDHPNICTIYEVDEAEDRTFISMAYLDGETLAEKIQAGPLGIDAAIGFALRIAEGLRHAHNRGIIHRDIKPANIMVTADGQAKIMDFGLAKLTGKTRLTKTATVMGTIAYMSPEQARGDKDIGHQTDIWSLGVLLFEMLTGELPFEAETDTGLIYKIINEAAEPIKNHRTDIPESLASLLGKTLHKDPQGRYQDAKDLIADLEAVKSELTMPMQKPSASIAVLPFINMSADPEQEYFCDGLAEELINGLTQLKGLHVVARTSAFSFKGKDVKIRDIGRELNVATVLEGSVRKAGNRLRITAQLVKVDDGYHIWSEKYDRNLEDIFEIQDEISETIVDRLKPTLMGQPKPELRKRQTVNLDAYNFYLKGRWFFWNKTTVEGFSKAIECFQQAIEIAPDYALAYAGLADAYLELSYFASFAPKQVYPKARAAALRALELDENLAEAHVSMMLINMAYSWDWEGAEKEAKKAIELNPEYAFAHISYAFLQMYRGRFDQAITELKRALELDPLSLFIYTGAGLLYMFAGKPEQAIEALQRRMDLDPNSSGVHFLLGVAYWMNSRTEDAIAEFEKEKKVSTGIDPIAETWLGIVATLTGKIDECRDILQNLLQRYEKEYVSPLHIALLFFSLGEFDRGFEWLDKAYEEKDSMMAYLKVHPFIDVFGLRSDPRYQAILKKIGLDE